VLQGLLGQCSEEEKKLAAAAIRNKRCVKVEGRYCHQKKLGVCVEKRDSYCCYGSQLARIIQEIAHQQLSIPWGDAQNPHCVPLTAEQLSQIDFDTPYAQSKLSEVLAETQASATEKFERVQQAVGSIHVQEKADALEKRQKAEFEKIRAEVK
jgi:conjugal transfer mating pair stabilization protein TraN